MRSRRAKRILTVVIGTLALAAVGLAYANQRDRQTRHAIAVTGGDPEQAMRAIARYGCASCHDIPGAQAPGGLAASPLSGVTDRVYLGGAVENTPDNLVRWIVNPKRFAPDTAMPITGVSEDEARNIAAYFYQRR
jgi:cytochrome c2